MMDRHQKYELLKSRLAELGNVAIAFSGGVDSTFLLKAAHDVLGDKAIAITIKASIHPQWEFEETKQLVKRMGAPHIWVNYDVYNIKGFAENPSDRCYLCKRELFSLIGQLAAERDIHHILDGSNYDDLSDYRPGMKALKELQILSPLRECEMTKEDIRYYSRELHLPTWDKPSYACLASRIPYGEVITDKKLSMVEEAEDFLMHHGFKQVRVRHHGDITRIEIGQQEIHNFLDESFMRKTAETLRKIGFSYVTLDLGGYRTGSLNEVLPGREQDNGGK